MDISYIIPIVGLIISLIVGFFMGKSIAGKSSELLIENAKKEAELVKSEAANEGERLKNEKLLQAKEQAIKLQSETDKKVNQKRKSIDDLERSIKKQKNEVAQKQNAFKKQVAEVEGSRKELKEEKSKIDKQRNDLKAKQENLDKQTSKLEADKKELEDKLQTELEKVAGLSREDAKQQLVEAMKEQARTKAMTHVKQVMDEAKISANREAKKIVLQSIQRLAAEHAIENCVSVFNLDNDDIKGQIIGREGRNIRALESATGVEVIVDDTPGAIIISCYDPVRREIARLSLQRLVADGRIHPARIEEIVNKTRKQLNQHIVEIGERTVIDLKIHGLHKDLVRMVGRMRYRSSYGQNLLQHSREVANLSAIMAAEMKLSKKQIQQAKRAGLLHDIGKVTDEESELSHALIGMKLAERWNEKADVCNAIGAHHDEIEMTHIISPIVQAADAISGARPGARREIFEAYMQRIRDLEALALEYEGVEKAYAMQAGRELRVIVQSEKVSDEKVDQLAFDISQKIEADMQYPGQIKVNVIREKRAVSYAK